MTSIRALYTSATKLHWQRPGGMTTFGWEAMTACTTGTHDVRPRDVLDEEWFHPVTGDGDWVPTLRCLGEAVERCQSPRAKAVMLTMLYAYVLLVLRSGSMLGPSFSRTRRNLRTQVNASARTIAEALEPEPELFEVSWSVLQAAALHLAAVDGTAVDFGHELFPLVGPDVRAEREARITLEAVAEPGCTAEHGAQGAGDSRI